MFILKKILLFIFLALYTNQSVANSSCFLLVENDVVIKNEGECSTRYSPCSTFKLALALMGYDSKILTDEIHPDWPFNPEYEAFLESWKNTQNPTTWMKNSCVWYSQVLTSKLEMNKFKNYVQKFNYGNQDILGDKGKSNGLTHAWLSSSLEISPEEQAVFLEKLVTDKLPVSRYAQEMTKRILFIEDLPNGWKLYGKTGSGFLLNADKTEKLDLKHGWFIGWIEKESKIIIFVNHIVDTQKQESYAGLRAKDETKEKLIQLLNSFDSK